MMVNLIGLFPIYLYTAETSLYGWTDHFSWWCGGGAGDHGYHQGHEMLLSWKNQNQIFGLASSLMFTDTATLHAKATHRKLHQIGVVFLEVNQEKMKDDAVCVMSVCWFKVG